MPKIIVLRFPTFAGSHFIANCFALHKRILHMDYNHARNKMLGKHTRLQSFAVSMMPALRTQMMDSHFEYNTFNGMVGYKNDLWNKVMDQDYYTPVVENNSSLTEILDDSNIDIEIVKQCTAKLRQEYPDAIITQQNTAAWDKDKEQALMNQQTEIIHNLLKEHKLPDGDKELATKAIIINAQQFCHELDGELDKVHIRSVNTKWLMENRNEKDWSMKKIAGVDTIDFDMGTILDAEQFYKEITRVTDYLQFDPIDEDQIKIMLSVWIKGIKIVLRGGYLRMTGNKISKQDLIKKLTWSEDNI